MNAEVIKAMKRKERNPSKFSKWWAKKSYIVWRIVFFPVWLSVSLAEKIDNYLYSLYVWNEEKADEILSYYIPRVVKWNAEEKSFYFFDNGSGWLHNRKKIKWKDRKWWDIHRGFSGGRIRQHLIRKFELEDFEKIIGNIEDCWTEITFKLIEK